MDQQLSFYLDEKIFEGHEPVFISEVSFKNPIKLHAHDFIEIAYVASGQGAHRIGSSQYRVSKGNLFIINYNIPHEFTPEPELLVCNCIFTPGFIDHSLISNKDFSSIAYHFLFRSLFPEEESTGDILLLNPDNWPIEELFGKMLREFKARQDGYVEILRAYIIELLVLVFRTLKRNNISGDPTEVSRRQLIEKVIKHMKDHYANDMKLEELSMLAFLSPSHFARLFKDYTGSTVSNFTQRLRIEEACRLLKFSDRKVTDVAADVGYRDIKYFNQVFKKITGKTPGEYRRSVQ